MGDQVIGDGGLFEQPEDAHGLGDAEVVDCDHSGWAEVWRRVVGFSLRYGLMVAYSCQFYQDSVDIFETAYRPLSSHLKSKLRLVSPSKKVKVVDRRSEKRSNS